MEELKNVENDILYVDENVAYYKEMIHQLKKKLSELKVNESFLIPIDCIINSKGEECDTHYFYNTIKRYYPNNRFFTSYTVSTGIRVCRISKKT